MDENMKNEQTEEFLDQDFRDTFGDGEELKKVFDAEPDVQTPEVTGDVPQVTETHIPTEPEEEKPGRKGRPARKKGYGLFGIPHMLATVIWLAIIVWVGVSLGRVLWVCATDVLAFGREEQIVSVTIEETDTLDDVAH